MRNHRNPEKGSVLMSVMWIVLVLSLVSFALASTVRVEMESSIHSFDSERAFFMAKSAAEIVFNSEMKQQPLPDDGPVKKENGEYIFPFDAGEARVRFGSDAGLININGASDVLLASIFDSLGVDRETRNRLVDSVLDWIDVDDIPHLYGAEIVDYPVPVAGQSRRPRNAGFDSVDELLLVSSMTPEIFFGSLVFDPVSNQYRRIPGLREIVSVRSADAKVDPNVASKAVLNALPLMNPQIVEYVVAARDKEKFGSVEDLEKRVPEVQKATLEYFRFDADQPFELVSKAVIKSSGVSRTVRLLFRREEVLRIITTAPLLYTRKLETKVDRWRYE